MVETETFVQAINEGLAAGDSLAEIDEYCGPFDALELSAIRRHLTDRISSSEAEWVDTEIRQRVLGDIEQAAEHTAKCQATFEAADEQMLSLCAVAAASGVHYTTIGRRCGASRQVITKRLHRFETRKLSCRAA